MSFRNWFPGCGPDLIKKGIPVFKYFGDLRPEEVLDLFLYFKDRPDYDSSVYKTFAMRDIFDFIDAEVKDVDEDIDIKDHLELNDITHS